MVSKINLEAATLVIQEELLDMSDFSRISGIDKEWIILMKKARRIGLTPQEIRAYISMQQITNQNAMSNNRTVAPEGQAGSRPVSALPFLHKR